MFSPEKHGQQVQAIPLLGSSGPLGRQAALAAAADPKARHRLITTSPTDDRK
jgi:hypothetical protein